MGCDIRMVLEKKCEGGEWVGLHNYPHLSIVAFGGNLPEQVLKRAWAKIRNRNYELFGRLAGVRQDGPDPLGVPEDVSQLARVEISGWGDDGHSHSYLSLREFTKRYVACSDHIGKAAADRLRGDSKIKDAEIICAGGYDAHEYEDVDTSNDVRIVFWFVN